MKVIKKGRPQKGWAKEFICSGHGNGDGGCGAKLLIEFDDLFKTARHYYDGGFDIFITSKCIECGVLTDIPKAKWPLDISSIPDQKKWESLPTNKSLLHG